MMVCYACLACCMSVAISKPIFKDNLMSDYTPKPEQKFTFGLWTVGNIGRDPFGGPVRDQKSPMELVLSLIHI